MAAQTAAAPSKRSAHLRSPEPLPATWEILEYAIPRAKNLKAIVFECERNAPEETLEVFERLNSIFPPAGNTQ